MRRYYMTTIQYHAKRVKTHAKTKKIPEVVKIDNDMGMKSSDEQVEIIHNMGRDLCTKYLSQNHLADGKTKHIPFKHGSVRLVVKLTNITSEDISDISQEDQELYEKCSFIYGDSTYFSRVKLDTRRA